jgi:hypothetical protein
VNVLLGYTFLRELYPRRTVRIVLALFAVSPWQLFMSMNLMTHTATLTAALVAAIAVARLRRHPRPGLAVLGGVGIGIVGLIRPLEGAALALALGVWSLGARGQRFRLWPAALLTLSTTATAALVLPYNRALMGSAGTFPIMAYTDQAYGPGSNALGFGANRGMPWPGLDPFPGHGPLDAVVNTNMNLFQINVDLLGWGTGSLLLILAFAAAGRWRTPDRWMAGFVAWVIGLHGLYYFSGGPDFGARYWYLAILPCLVLVGRGLEELERISASRDSLDGRRPLLGAAALVLVALLVFIPWRAVDKYHHYRGMRPDIRTLADAPGLDRAVLLIQGRRHPDFASAAAFNPIDLLGGGPVLAWDLGPEIRRGLVEAYPDRPFYLIAGPTLTGGAYAIGAGPLTAAELLSRPDTLETTP